MFTLYYKNLSTVHSGFNKYLYFDVSLSQMIPPKDKIRGKRKTYIGHKKMNDSKREVFHHKDAKLVQRSTVISNPKDIKYK